MGRSSARKTVAEVPLTGLSFGDLRRQWQQLSRELEVAAIAESSASRPTTRLGRKFDDEPAGSRVVESPRFDPPPAD